MSATRLDNEWIFKIRGVIGRTSKQRRSVGKPEPNLAPSVICELKGPQLRCSAPNMDYRRGNNNSISARRVFYWWGGNDWHRRRDEKCSCLHFVFSSVDRNL